MADPIVDLMVLPSTDGTSLPCSRVWELRANLTPYEALAELTGAVLVTGDERITVVPGTRWEIQVTK